MKGPLHFVSSSVQGRNVLAVCRPDLDGLVQRNLTGIVLKASGLASLKGPVGGPEKQSAEDQGLGVRASLESPRPVSVTTASSSARVTVAFQSENLVQDDSSLFIAI